MSDRTPFQDWLEAQIKAHVPPTANALALTWGLPSSYLTRWRQGGVPEFYRIPHLAAKSGTPEAELERIISASTRIRSERRRPPGRAFVFSTLRKPTAKVSGRSMPPRAAVAV